MTDPKRSISAVSKSSWRWVRPGRFLRDLNIVAVLALLAAAAGLFMSPQADDVLLGLPDFRLGEVSPRTIRSPRALTIGDPEKTQELRDEVAARVPPVFDQEVSLVDNAADRVEAAFQVLLAHEPAEDEPTIDGPPPDAGERAAEVDPDDLRLDFAERLQVVLSKKTLDALIAGPPDELRDAILFLLTTVGERPIVGRSRDLPPGRGRLTVLEVSEDARQVREIKVDETSRILTLDQARAEVDALAAERLKHLPSSQRRAAALLVKELLEVNLVRNLFETNRRRGAARDSVKEMVIAIRPGEVVVKAGDIVDEQKLRILEGMEKDLRATSRVQVAAGSALLVLLLVGFAHRVASRSCRPDRPASRDLAFLSAAVLLTLLTLWAGFHGVASVIDYTPWVAVETLRMGLPVAFGVLLVRLIAGVEAAAVFAPVVAIIAGWMMDASLAVTVYAFAGGLAAASIEDGHRLTRSLFSATTRIIFAQATVATAFDLLDSNLDLRIATEHLAAATVSAVSAALLAAAWLAVFEAVFGYATSLRLGQLANLNHPLLKQMVVEAPGTYRHSIMVGTMAEAAARAIGAHRLLARVGGYYHDIGKLKNPRAFDENLPRDVGPIATAAQATELRAHVEDGIELAHQHRLGSSVIDIIRQHHGTGKVRQRSRLGPTTAPGAAEGPVTYPGPRPRGREAALVMLADAVEASTRHLDQELVVERADIERAVTESVQVILRDGQLDDAELTLRDLEQTRSTFVDVLEVRLARSSRPLSTLPEVTGAPIVRAPTGEPS